MPPPQKKSMRGRNNRRYIPAEIIEEILLNLPFRSLLRFSSVSKSWNSMIYEPYFVKKYHMSEGNFLFLSEETAPDSTCPISPISWDTPTMHEIDFVSPFDEQPRLMATCDELWLAHDGKSLFLWNPSMGTRRKIPNPKQEIAHTFTFGLGYDSNSDDYKVVKISKSFNNAEAYSLRSDSWRDVEIPHDLSAAIDIDIGRRGCVFVSGKLHWLDYPSDNDFISFDLSTEEFGSLAMPPFETPRFKFWKMEVSVLRGMMCVSLSYYTYKNAKIVCVIWVMEDYGVAKSWTNKFTIACGNSIPYRYEWIVPLYYYDNGEILLRVNERDDDGYRIYVYKDDKTRPVELMRSRTCGRILGGLLYTPMQSSRQRIFSK